MNYSYGDRYNIGVESRSPSLNTTSALTPTEFSAAVSAITNSFGDPSRRNVYLFAHERGQDGITAAEVAQRFGLHPNVARHHLDKLAASGHLEVSALKSSRITRGRATE